MNHSFSISEMSFFESNLISFRSHHDIWNLSLSAPAVQPFRGTLKSLTWHLAWYSSCHYLSFSASPFTLCSSLLSLRANLKTSGLMFKAKGLESFPPTTQAFPFKEKHELAEENYSQWTEGRVLPKDEANSSHIIWPCKNCSYKH